jgi:hypothetical protein
MLLEDIEVTSTSLTDVNLSVDRAIDFSGWGGTLRRGYLHGTRRGIDVGSNSITEYTYMGDNVNPGDDHASAIKTNGGSRHVIIRYNTLQTAPGTNASSSISFYPEVRNGGSNDDFLVEGNLLNAGAYYCVYAGYTPPEEQPNTNFRFLNNRFGTLYGANCGREGPVASWSVHPSNVWSGNTWYDLRPTTSSYTNKNGKTVTP